MLPPDGALNTAQGFHQSGPNNGPMASCAWFERFFNMLFPPDESQGQETVAPCAAGR
ncbi:unnamed protein product [Gongylonema pulchrum]|uniref:S-formylglutathione hydrolase n=1 Tax=Gongylonema pulchrum TaxID=637853 RepID=A0A183DMF1_9BILA|nr:unnamed protein product [Gongylonema pulchrum]